MSRNATARSDAGTVLSLADELLEHVLLQAIDVNSRRVLQLPCNHLLRVLISQSGIDAHRLSATCRRFRQILLPRIYCEVNIYPHTLSQVQNFLDLTPAYGHLCQTLIVDIPTRAQHRFTVLDLLCDYLRYFTALRVLHLGVTDYWPHTSIFVVRPEKKLCSALPKVSELHLYGFSWADAMDGLAHSNMSSVQTLSLDLAGKPTLEMATVFHHAFTGIVSVTLSYWRITPDWIRAAFTGRKLTHLAIAGRDWATIFTEQRQLDDWAESVSLLIQLNPSSLTSLAINSVLGILLQITADLPCLTILAMSLFDFGDPNKFEAVMQSFVKCPLQSLRIGCKGVPETFHTWFGKDSKLWPDLQTLSLEVETFAGPGDKAWDEADPEERAMWEHTVGFDMWTPYSRLALESHCFDRGINYEDEMIWIS